MRQVDTQRVYRVIDANLNRAKEGLRVCEDIMRFVHDNPSLTRQLKNVRHDLTDVSAGFDIKDRLKNRSASTDVGRPSTSKEFKRKKVDDLFFANIQRAKESVRVLEECSKLLNKRSAEKFKTIRYKIYAIETKAAA